MRGREPEWHTFIHLLRTAEGGQGGTLLVEGEPGSGKTLLLAEAASQASLRGFLPLTGGAEELGEALPLAPLLMALGLPDPNVDAGAVERLRARLVGCAATRPVLVALDDLQWADPATLAALRTLNWELAAEPVVWLLARTHTTRGTYEAGGAYRGNGAGGGHGAHASRGTPGERGTPGAHCVSGARVAGEEHGTYDEHGLYGGHGTSGGARGRGVECLFGALERHGAARVELGPLPRDVVAEVAADILGAAPVPDLLALAEGAGGDPRLLTAFLSGLRDEGAVEVSGGRARLLWAGVPLRVHALVRHLLDGLDRETRRFVEAAAVLGRSFSPEEAAELVGASPAALLPAVEEAMDTGLLVTTDEELEFRHELVWRAVAATLPPPMRHALHHQIGELLLDRGGTPMRAAEHLIEGTRPGDARVLTGLDHAVGEVLARSPRAAADLAVRAVELSDLADPARFTRVLTAIEATTEAGLLGEATGLANAALAGPLPGRDAAELHRALSGVLFMGGRPAEAVAEAEAALAEPHLSGPARDGATLALLHALAGLPDTRRAEKEADAILAGAGRRPHAGAPSEAVVAEAMVALAVIRWESGRLAEGLRPAGEAVRLAQDGSMAVRRAHPRLALASMLTDLRRLDEAEAVLRDAGAEVEALGHGAWAAGPAVLRARLELILGHPDEAEARAREGCELAAALGTHLYSPLAACVLGTVALRRGDLRTAARHLEADRDRLSRHAATPPAGCALVAAQVAEAGDGPAGAMKLVAHLYPDLLEHCSVLVGDPAAAPWLTRVALASGDRGSAGLAVAAAERLADRNPGFRTLRTAAVHARGLLDAQAAPDDAARALGRAAGESADPWARASAAEDLGVALTAAGDRREAVRSLDQALAGYEESGSARDSARLRRRLRRLGVRHRHWATADRPVSGWPSLTDTERAVSLLVAQGWTNRQVADQMFISVHTVAFHLRQIFRKLSIGSRVDLTRLTMEHDHDPESRRTG